MYLLRSYRPSNWEEFSKMTNDFYITNFGSNLTAHNFLSFKGMDLKLHHVLVEKLVFSPLFTELKLMHTLLSYRASNLRKGSKSQEAQEAKVV